MSVKSTDVRPASAPAKPEDQELARKGDEQAALESELAERELRFSTKTYLAWGQPEYIEGHDMLAYTLAQFYLGRIFEETGRKAEAINAYQEFLSHFEDSHARLPQISAAQAAVKRLL